jgi:diaminopimelate epimerase
MTPPLPETIEFTKLNAGGNDFICIDNTTGLYSELLDSEHLSAFVRALCRRGLAVGADGVIFACETGDGSGIDIVARFMEPDGSEARLCGNGTACFSYWCLDRGLVKGPEINILTAAGTAQARPDEENPHRITVCVPNPRNLELCVDIETERKLRRVHLIDTGVPHAVAFVDDVDDVDVRYKGSLIRHHERFREMGGVNVNFTQVIKEGTIKVRTFEFGVEDETLACGTGSTAAAIISALLLEWPEKYLNGQEPVSVRVRGQETLRIWFTRHEGNVFTDTCLETGARPVYEGTLRAEFVDRLLHGCD